MYAILEENRLSILTVVVPSLFLYDSSQTMSATNKIASAFAV